MDDMIMVTNWETVDVDDFYLTDKWMGETGEENMEEARKLAKDGNLFEAYVVSAKDFCIYYQMDAHQIFINRDGEEMISCEGKVINAEFNHKEEYKL